MTNLEEVIIGLISGGAFVEGVRWFLNRGKEKRQGDLDISKMNFEQQQEMRGELLAFNAVLDERITKQDSKIAMQDSKIADQNDKILEQSMTILSLQKQQIANQADYLALHAVAELTRRRYDELTAYVGSILVWLEGQGIEIPLKVPVYPDLPPVPNIRKEES